jgi:hypothetical protein
MKLKAPSLCRDATHGSLCQFRRGMTKFFVYVLFFTNQSFRESNIVSSFVLVRSIEGAWTAIAALHILKCMRARNQNRGTARIVCIYVDNNSQILIPDGRKIKNRKEVLRELAGHRDPMWQFACADTKPTSASPSPNNMSSNTDLTWGKNAFVDGLFEFGASQVRGDKSLFATYPHQMSEWDDPWDPDGSDLSPLIQRNAHGQIQQ